MVEGVSRCGRQGQGGRGPAAAVAFVALLTLAGCGSEDADDGGGGLGFEPPTPGWISGGQTGSLTPPRCGLAPLAELQGVSASTGIVAYTAGCAAPLPGELALFDAQGNAVPAQAQSLGPGVVLVTPTAGLEPGSYTLGGLPPAPVDEGDGGADDDADGDGGIPAPGEQDAGAISLTGGEPVVVLEPSAAPMRLGALTQTSGTCSAGLDLLVDPALIPHLPSLALDLRVGAGGVPLRIVPFGTLVVSSQGVAHVAIPLGQLQGGGPHTVTLEGELAGRSFAIEPATLQISCLPAAPAPTSQRAPVERAGCSAPGGAPRSPPGAAALFSALLPLGLYRRRRRRRPPD